MTIQERFNLLKDYFNEDIGIINSIAMKHDFYIRDIHPHLNGYEVDPTHKLQMNVPDNRFLINHGYGELKGADKQIHGIQIRYYDSLVNDTFEFYIAKKEAKSRGENKISVSPYSQIWI